MHPNIPSKTLQEQSRKLPRLYTTAEVSEILRISRRSVEELGKSFCNALSNCHPGEPPPSSPKYGLRRTYVTTRKLYYHESDVSEYLQNCRRESEGLEPVHIALDVF